MKLVGLRQEDGQRNWVGAGGGWFALVTSEGEKEYQENIIQSQVFLLQSEYIEINHRDKKRERFVSQKQF